MKERPPRRLDVCAASGTGPNQPRRQIVATSGVPSNLQPARRALAADETQTRRSAELRPPDRRDDAAAHPIGRARGDLLCRSDGRLVAARDGLPLRGSRACCGARARHEAAGPG